MSGPDISPIRAGVIAIDAGAVGVIAAAIVGWLPPLAAIVAILWYVIQIYESQTVQRKVRAWRLRKLVKLRAETVALELALRTQNYDLRALDEATQVHKVAVEKAAELSHLAAKKETEEIQAQRLEDALFSLKDESKIEKHGPFD
jgi:hypothetical protein